MKMREGISFDDVLLVPQYSEIETRSKVDLSVQFGSLKFSHPIIPANMLNVTGRDMAWAVINGGGLAILNRFIHPQEQIEIVKEFVDKTPNRFATHAKNCFAISVGVKPEDKEMVKTCHEIGIRIFCVDVAHGDSKLCVEMVKWIRENYDTVVIAGNVATGSGAKRLWEAGAGIVKVGIGNASVCSTRIETGAGVPQLTAIMDVAKARDEMLTELKWTHAKAVFGTTKHNLPIIADGGIRFASDVVKSLAAGADMVMIGSLFAGTQESPGQRIRINDKDYKEYSGSSTHKSHHIEGVEALVPYKGTYKEVLTKLLEGLASGCSYQGASNLEELRQNFEFIRITNSGLVESHPHDVLIK